MEPAPRLATDATGDVLYVVPTSTGIGFASSLTVEAPARPPMNRAQRRAEEKRWKRR